MLFFSNKSILKRVVSEADPHPAGTAAPVARAISPPIPADPHPAGTARAYRRYCPKKRTEWRPAGGGAPEPPAEPPALRCPACEERLPVLECAEEPGTDTKTAAILPPLGEPARYNRI